MGVWLAEREVFPGVSLIRATGMEADLRRHSHRSVILGVVRRGRRHVLLQDGGWEIAAGGGFVLPAGCVHRCVLLAAHAYRVVCIGPEYWARLFGAAPLHARPFSPESAPVLAIRQLLAGLRSDPRVLAFETQLQAVHEAIEPGASQPDEFVLPERLRALRDWLDIHCAEPVRLTMLAERAGCSPARINRLFSQAFGMPPHEYLMQRRLGEAARRLRGGMSSLADIAADLGFADQSHLQRFFKRAYGTTPGAYRRASDPLRPAPG